MTFPVLIPIGPWRLEPHLVFESLAYLVGLLWYLARRRRLGDRITDANRWSVLTAAIVGAAIGSRLLAAFELAPSAGLLQPLGGKTIVGGLAGGWIATELEKIRSGIRESTGDLYVFPLIAGIAIGRIGCFLAGLPDRTYGVATTLPWGVDLGDGVMRHPTALYESVVLIATGIVLARLVARLAPGQLFRLFMLTYFTFRVAVDAIKPGVPVAFGLTAIQWTCLVGAIVSLRLLIRQETGLVLEERT
jgi:phosphatidylglycerol---prolipoprotein diacylglyceryl transferase